MKKSISLVLALIMTVALLAGCGQQAAPATEAAEPASEPVDVAPAETQAEPVEPITIRVASTVQSTMPSGAAAEKFCQLVEEKTEGRYKVEYYPARQLGETNDLLTQVINGTLEIAQVSNASFGSYSTLLECLSLPFLIDSYDKLSQAVESDELKAIYDKIEEICGVKCLTIMEHGIQFVANTVRPINTPEDFKGLKLRTNNSNVMYAAIEAFGGAPINYAYGQIYTGMQNKTIDGEVVNFTTVFAEKHYEVATYFSELGLWPFPCTLVMSEQFNDSLSEADRAAIYEAAKEAYEYNVSLLEEYTDRARTEMEKAGVEINKIEDMTPFIEAVAPIIEKERESDPLVAAFVDMAQGLK